MSDAECRPAFSQGTNVKDGVSVEEVGSEGSAASNPYFRLTEIIQ